LRSGIRPGLNAKFPINFTSNLVLRETVPYPVMVFLQCKPHKVKVRQVILTQMLNAKDVATYCNETKNNPFQFIGETIPLLPNLDFINSCHKSGMSGLPYKTGVRNV
jgi:hypothetical protein